MDADKEYPEFPSTVHRISSCESVRKLDLKPLKVSFSDTISPERALASEPQSSIFCNPFGEGEPTPRSMSITSDASDLPQSSAFSSHRDTLARLHNSVDCDSSDGDNTYTPTQAGFSLFRSPYHPLRRDTLTRLHFKQNSDLALPNGVLDTILSYVDQRDYKNMRLTCRDWAYHLPRLNRSAAHRLPHEVLAKILYHLHPVDFDAARHTCRAWFLASLDHRIGMSMLRSAGCHPAFLQDIEQARNKLVHDAAKSKLESENVESCGIGQVDQEWLMSKRLATESRLSAAWRGSGIQQRTGRNLSSFSVVENVDFEKLLYQPGERQSPTNKQRHFTVSACSKYLLLVVGKEIFVYSLVESYASLVPVARLVAGRKVIAASMDTTSGRQSVAALLEGRIGISWDLDQQVLSGAKQGEPLDLGMKTDIHGLTSFGASRPIPIQDLSRITPALEQSQYFLTRRTSVPDPLPFSLYGPDETNISLHGVVSCHTESPESTPP